MTKKYIENNDLRRSNERFEGKMSDAIQHGESMWYDEIEPPKKKQSISV